MSAGRNGAAPHTLADALRHAAKSDGDLVFISGERSESTLSYRDLLAEASRVLAHLQVRGAAERDYLVLQIDDERTFLIVFWACQLGGMIPVPVHAGSKPDQLEKVARIVAALPSPWIAAPRARLDQLAELGARGLPVDELGGDRAEPRYASPARDDLALIQYSSGSTGAPNGVMLTHRNLMANTEAIVERGHMTAADCFLTWMPLTHDMGLILNHIAPLRVGARFRVMPTSLFIRRPGLWLAKASEHRATHLAAPNFGLYYALAAFERGGTRELDLSAVRMIYNGAEPISARLIERFMATFAPMRLAAGAMTPCYGLAEGSVGVTCTNPGEPVVVHRLDRASLTVGAPVASATGPASFDAVELGFALDHVELAIADDDDALLPPMHQGRVLIRGTSVTQGYFNDPGTSASRRVAGDWFDTGDLGFLTGAGRLAITGRAKDLIIVGGTNYYPHDIEAALADLDGIGPGEVAACAVSGTNGEELAVFVRFRGNDDALAALAAAVRRRVADTFGLVAHHVVPIRQIPKTTSGKIQRFALAQSFVAPRAPVVAPPPRTQLAALVREEAQAVLGSAVDVDRPLADQGFTSLLAVDLARRLGVRLGRELSPALAYECPTVSALARHLAAGADAPTTAPHVASDEPIALVGVGLRLPGGVDDLEQLWAFLQAGGDGIGPVPLERWDHAAVYDPSAERKGYTNAREGGFLRDVDRFDCAAFGISPAEAREIDPQQRILLETAWRALEHAGIDTGAWHGAPVGVFVGLSNTDYAARSVRSGDPQRIEAYSVTGTASSIAAGRLSYVFGFEGPALTLDTACSSSLVATHLAMASLRRGECSAALAAGVNLILDPAVHIGFSRLHAMAGDGRCKAFDAAADGYGRAEGCVVVVLKRLSDARADGDRIFAVLRGSAVNQDGASNGLTAPSGRAQRAVMTAALAASGVAAHEVDFVEAHGTGTPLGDAQEAGSIAAVYGAGREWRLAVGSAKTNFGHTESAAGLTGLVKAALAVERGIVPPNLHFTTPNPHIPWADLSLTVPTAPLAWPHRDGPRRAGVSSFGLSGTNAHVIVEQPPAAELVAATAAPALLLPLSARSPEALALLRDRWLALLAEAPDDLGALVATAARRRAHHPYRVSASGADASELHAALAAARVPERRRDADQRVVFVFPGQGSQWLGMARDLLDESAPFRAAFDEAAAAIAAETGLDALALLRDGDAAALAPIDVMQPLLFAVGVALAAAWRALGVEPDAVIGHSMGEAAAAYVAGALTLADAAAVICRRSRLMRALSGGAMLVVALGSADAAEAAAAEPGVALAAENAPESTVLSGEADAIERVAERLEARGIDCRRVRVDVASHSSHVDPILGELVRKLDGIAPRVARLPIYSTVTGAAIGGAELGPRYWADNLRRPVRFATAVAAADAGLYVELSAHPLLTAPVELTLRARGRDAVAVGSLRRDAPGPRELLANLGLLYEAGYPVAWARVGAAPSVPAALPPYPFVRERFWLDPPVPQRAAGWPGRPLPVAGERMQLWEATLDLAALPELGDHRVHGEIVVPAAAWVVLVLAATRSEALGDVRFHEPVVLRPDGAADVQVQCRSAAFTVHVRRGEDWRLTASGTLRAAPADPIPSPGETFAEIDGATVYAGLAEAGLEYGPAFRGLRALRLHTGGTTASVVVPGAGEIAQAARLDAVLHAAVRWPLGPDAMLPVVMHGVRLRGPLPERMEVRTAELEPPPGGGRATAVTAAGDDGDVLTIERVELAPIAGAREHDVCHVVRWRPVEPTASRADSAAVCAAACDPPAAVTAAVIDGDGPLADRLRRAVARGVGDIGGRAFYVVASDDTLHEERTAADCVAAAVAFADRLRRATVENRPVTLVTAADGPVEAALTAMLQSAAAEAPALAAVCVHVDGPADDDAVARVLSLAEPGVYRLAGGTLVAPALVPLPAPAPATAPAASYRAVLDGIGADAVAFRAANMPRPGPGQVVVEVAAAGLNFINALSALRAYPGIPGGFRSLGIEAAGRVVRCAPDVSGLQPGDRVAGIVEHALASHALADARVVVPVRGLSDAAAAGLPIAYLTAAIALEDVARLRPGESVLVHAATGGVGQAAIALARRLGARVLATAGSDAKRRWLREQGVADVFDSRSDAFVEGVLAATAGRGVDCVLNSLSGPLFDAGFEVLAPGGRFVELGKRDLYGPGSLPFHRLREGRSFASVDLDALVRDRPAEIGARLAGLVADVEAGRLPVLPTTERPVSDAGAALAEMAAARHLGKLVLSRRLGEPHVVAPAGAAVRADATYLITGGWGALGAAIAGWLVDRGARSIVLTGRSAPGAELADRAEAWRGEGVEVTLAAVDAADGAGMTRLFDRIDRTLPRLAGIVHAAGILDDRRFDELDAGSLRRVFAPKLGGVLALHALTQDRRLDFFVALSSLAAHVGPAGQANYAAANAAMEAVIRARRAAGLPGTALALGPVAAGLVTADARRRANVAASGWPVLEVGAVTEALARALAGDEPLVVAVDVQGATARHALLEACGAAPRRPSAAPADLTDGDDRLDRIEALVAGELARVLRVEAGGLDRHAAFKDLGLDSLMAMQVQARLNDTLGLSLNVASFWAHPSIAAYVRHVDERLARRTLVAR